MESQRIRLRAVSGALQGKSWESDLLLRIGRLQNLEIVLENPSISRRHAEVRHTEEGWVIQDLGSTNGTFVNGVRVGRAGMKIQPNDVLQCGELALLVVAQEEEPKGRGVQSGCFNVKAVAQRAWKKAVEGLTPAQEQRPQAGERLLTLLRAGYHLGHLSSPQELLQAILDDTVTALEAQRGAIILMDETTGKLNLRVVSVGKQGMRGGASYSKTLAQRSFSQGESLLCCDVIDDLQLQQLKSVQTGTMSSIICALLRSPRTQLGVLHLDRGPLQEPFTPEDLNLADAIAATVSAGIESAQLLEKQRELMEKQRNLFIQTVTALAHAVDARDRQTGNHSQQVTDYALLLAEELQLPALERHYLQIGTPLRDIGKIGIAEAILQKEGNLTPAEFDQLRSHPLAGVALLASIPDLEPILTIVRSHHEHWDGSGYPDGLAGERIPRLARIVAVADAFDAMTAPRPGRTPLSLEKAFAELWDQAGRQFDPDCVQAFLRIRLQIEELVYQLKDSPCATVLPYQLQQDARAEGTSKEEPPGRTPAGRR
ncbi:MAG: FHA domain-containing protein [Gemmataceae bacterium]|nr:FHA domain-containing protein [Gemmataceae bacterium]